MLPAQVRNRDTALSLADHTHDLGVTKAITLHQNLLILTLKNSHPKVILFVWGGVPGYLESSVVSRGIRH